MLHYLGCLRYSPPLESHIRGLKPLPSGSSWEVELRGTSIWCIELFKREIERRHPEVTSTKSVRQSLGHASRPSDGGEKIDENKFTTQKRPKQNSVHELHVSGVNAILIDFFLYDTIKSIEKEGREIIPHHRTRCIWY